MDVTAYLNTYRMTAHELAMTMIREKLDDDGTFLFVFITMCHLFHIPILCKPCNRVTYLTRSVRFDDLFIVS